MAEFYRSHRLSRCWIALVLLIAGWGVPLSLPHVADDDLLCAIGEGVAGTTRARVDASGTETTAEHCVICHAARTFRADLSDGKLVAIGLLPSTVVRASVQAPHLRSTIGRLPARAPPLA